MRKYNIPLKDVKEIKQEIVECSSSGSGEGVKEYYYKAKDINGIDILSLGEVIITLNNMKFIINIEGSFNKIEISSFVHISNLFINDDRQKIYGFKYIDTEVLVFSQFDDLNTYHIIKSGNLETRFRELGKISGIPNTEMDSAIIAMNNLFEEITKEEYDNICIDIMKNETAGYNKETLYEMYIAYNNQVEEMFKQ